VTNTVDHEIAGSFPVKPGIGTNPEHMAEQKPSQLGCIKKPVPHKKNINFISAIQR
jgi:hypothetical protein